MTTAKKLNFIINLIIEKRAFQNWGSVFFLFTMKETDQLNFSLRLLQLRNWHLFVNFTQPKPSFDCAKFNYTFYNFAMFTLPIMTQAKPTTRYAF